MLSLNYVLSIVLAVVVLKENITLFKCIGVLIIITGWVTNFLMYVNGPGMYRQTDA